MEVLKRWGFELSHLTCSLRIRCDTGEGGCGVNREISVFVMMALEIFVLFSIGETECLESVVAWLTMREKTYLLKWRWHTRLRTLVPQHILNFDLLISFKKEELGGVKTCSHSGCFHSYTNLSALFLLHCRLLLSVLHEKCLLSTQWVSGIMAAQILFWAHFNG